jgi:HK97 family phage major capsid protein
MEPNEVLLAEVKELTTNVKNLMPKAEEAQAQAKAAKEATETATKALDEFRKTVKVIEDNQGKADVAAAENQKALNEIATQMKAIKEGGIQTTNSKSENAFDSVLSKQIAEAHKDIQGVSKGNKVSLDLKAGANMTLAGDLTGSPNITYMPQPALIPAQKLNFRDLVSTFQSQTGLISLFRENGETSPQVGSIGQQLTEGATKNQVEYQFTNVQYVANYISGFVRISKQMLQDLLFLQTYLPQMLLRDFYKAENSLYSTQLAAGATGSTTSSGGNTAEKLIDYVTNIETGNYAVNGIVVPPHLWGSIMKTTVPSIGTSYSAPGGFMITPSGQISIAGIPILKASWMTAGTAFVGDWQQAAIAMVDNLRVEFFEQDSDNVQRNLVTVRVEAREVLVLERPAGFVYATSLT